MPKSSVVIGTGLLKDFTVLKTPAGSGLETPVIFNDDAEITATDPICGLRKFVFTSLNTPSNILSTACSYSYTFNNA